MADWALAGAGWMSAVHAMGVGALPGSRVVAVGSRTEAAAQDAAGRTGGRSVGLGELPAEADLVVVATPPFRHAEDALRALAAGAGVLVESPMCHRLVDADPIVRVAEAGGIVVYAENLLFAEATGVALTEIAGLGPLRHLSARALQAAPHWRVVDDPAWGGGVLFDLGVHLLAVVLRAAGEPPHTVTARYSTGEVAGDLDERAEVDLGFPSGLTAALEVSWRSPEPVWDVQAAADDGVVRVEYQPDVGVERDGEPVPLSTAPGDPGETGVPPRLEQLGYLAELRETEAAWRRGRASTISDAALGRDVLEIVCAASVSAREGRAVALPFDGPRDRSPAELWTGGVSPGAAPGRS